jgi:hypothetical protein
MNALMQNNYLMPLMNSFTREGWHCQHWYQNGEPEIRIGPWTVFVDSWLPNNQFSNLRAHEDPDTPTPSGIWYYITGEDGSLAFFTADRFQVVEWLRPYAKLFVAQ